MQKRLDSIQKRLDSMQKRLDSMLKRLDNMQKRLDSMQKRVAEEARHLLKRLDSMQKSLDSILKRLDSCRRGWTMSKILPVDTERSHNTTVAGRKRPAVNTERPHTVENDWRLIPNDPIRSF